MLIQKYLMLQKTAAIFQSSSEDSDDELSNNQEIDKYWNWSSKLSYFLDRLQPTLPKSFKTFIRINDAIHKIENMDESEGDVGSYVYFTKSGADHF